MNSNSLSYLDSGSAVRTLEELPRVTQSEAPAEQGSSFFRGAIIGVAVAVPAWAWIIFSIIR
ncbi:hypothetical protein [Acidisoma sp.]|uniref:hypothetical protein n=1 Tax=Acidisoma sp. TaxID=1872115 RepID=UPI003AFFBE14